MLFIISGIPPGDGGTGQLVSYLRDAISLSAEPTKVWLITKPTSIGRGRFFSLIRSFQFFRLLFEIAGFTYASFIFHIGVICSKLAPDSPLLMLHPQNLGYELALKILSGRRVAPSIYLLDSSFFCIASYNQIRGQSSPCLACLSKTSLVARISGCLPFPQKDMSAYFFTDELKKLVRSERLNLIAQNKKQAINAKTHFELPCPPVVAGLWSQDWEGLIAAERERGLLGEGGYGWDVVFHGHLLDSKGVGWLIEVAKNCPKLQFFFPFQQPLDYEKIPANCFFEACNWGNGLKDIVLNARYVAVPSLWSAPIEGSLIKSIAYGRAVIVVENETAFCSELPGGLVFSASPSPQIAAKQIEKLCQDDWVPSLELRNSWISRFTAENENFAENLFRLCRTMGIRR